MNRSICWRITSPTREPWVSKRTVSSTVCTSSNCRSLRSHGPISRRALLTTTGNQLDLGLAGKWLLRIELAHRESCIRGTASFRFRKPTSCKPRRVTRCAIRRDQGKPITVDPALPIDIDKTGAVWQGGQQIAQIEIDSIANPSLTLRKLGNSYFRPLGAGGPSSQLSIPARRSGRACSNNRTCRVSRLRRASGEHHAAVRDAAEGDFRGLRDEQGGDRTGRQTQLSKNRLRRTHDQSFI